MNRAFFFAFSVATVVFLLPAAPVEAQEAEARLLFERGNEHLAQGMRVRGRRRTAELQQALDAYLGVLRLGGETRNVIFNLALTLEELDREPEAFNYYSRYLRAFELSAEDRAEGQRRVDAMRPRLAVVTVESTPPGAAVRVDRRDLPVRGNTPLELALPEGAHTLYLQRDGYEEASAETTATLGETIRALIELVGQAVSVQIIAPSNGHLTVDGEPVQPGRAIPLRPGSHVARLEMPAAPPVERTFEVQPGAEPMTLELRAARGTPSGMTLHIDVPSSVFLDGVGIGHGTLVETPLPPGPHVVSVTAPGRNAASHRFTLQPEQALSFDVTMGAHPDAGGVNAGRAIFGIFAGLGVISSAVLGGLAIDLRSEWDGLIATQTPERPHEARLLTVASELEATALGADISIAATALFGTLTIIFIAVDTGADVQSSIVVAAAPAPGGATVAVSGRIGGP